MSNNYKNQDFRICRTQTVSLLHGRFTARCPQNNSCMQIYTV